VHHVAGAPLPDQACGRRPRERQGRIGQATQSWEATHQEYLAATARLEQEIQNAAREAARVRGEHRQQALDRRQATLDRADDRLGAALVALDGQTTAARGELQASAAELARLFATRLLGRKVAS
jgi:F0F1-type ATP synthase membrane subunit b/b'